jgi:hypothetical protein
VSSPDHHHADCLSQFWKDLEERASRRGLNLRSWHRRAKAVAERSGQRGYISYPTFQRWVRSRTRLSDWAWGDIQPIVLTAVGDQERDWKLWQARWHALQRRSGRRGDYPRTHPDGPPNSDKLVRQAYGHVALVCAALAVVFALLRNRRTS